MKLSCQILGHFVQSDHKPINIIFSLRHWMFTLMNCNRLNVCVPSNSCWSPNSLWWCLEVIRLRWGQEGGAPMNGISALLRGGRGQSPLFPSMWGHRKKAAFCRSALPRGQISGYLNSDCQPPELWERNAYCLSALPPPTPSPGVCAVLLQQSPLTKTGTIPSEKHSHTDLSQSQIWQCDFSKVNDLGFFFNTEYQALQR